MHKQEIPELSQRLAQLADALGGKAPSPAGLLVWGDALSECRTDDVKAVLTDWPKSHTKMPSPAEVLKRCREMSSDRIEAESKRNAATAPTIDSILAIPADGPNAKAFRRMWSAIRSKKASCPREWCNSVLASDRPEAAEFKDFAAASVALMGDEKPNRGKYWYEEKGDDGRVD